MKHIGYCHHLANVVIFYPYRMPLILSLFGTNPIVLNITIFFGQIRLI